MRRVQASASAANESTLRYGLRPRSSRHLRQLAQALRQEFHGVQR